MSAIYVTNDQGKKNSDFNIAPEVRRWSVIYVSYSK